MEYDNWLVLWENRPLWGWKERFTHPGVTMIVLWASFQADILWLPNEFLLLLTPNMPAFFNISTYGGSFQYAKITLFLNPQEGDFLTTRVNWSWIDKSIDEIQSLPDSSDSLYKSMGEIWGKHVKISQVSHTSQMLISPWMTFYFHKLFIRFDSYFCVLWESSLFKVKVGGNFQVDRCIRLFQFSVEVDDKPWISMTGFLNQVNRPRVGSFWAV